MSLKGVLPNLDGLDESIASYYTKSGDNYVLQVDLEGTGYASALDKIKAERNELKTEVSGLAKYKALDDLEGFDVSKAGEYMKKAAQAGSTDVSEAVEKATRPLIKQLETAQAKASESEGLVKAAQDKAADYMLGDQVKKAALESGVSRKLVDDVWSLTRNNFSLDESGAVSVVDSDGDATGKSLKDFFATDYKESKPQFYDAVDMKGSGSQSGKSSFNNSADMSATQKIEAGLSAT